MVLFLPCVKLKYESNSVVLTGMLDKLTRCHYKACVLIVLLTGGAKWITLEQMKTNIIRIGAKRDE